LRKQDVRMHRLAYVRTNGRVQIYMHFELGE